MPEPEPRTLARALAATDAGGAIRPEAGLGRTPAVIGSAGLGHRRNGPAQVVLEGVEGRVDRRAARDQHDVGRDHAEFGTEFGNHRAQAPADAVSLGGMSDPLGDRETQMEAHDRGLVAGLARRAGAPLRRETLGVEAAPIGCREEVPPPLQPFDRRHLTLRFAHAPGAVRAARCGAAVMLRPRASCGRARDDGR